MLDEDASELEELFDTAIREHNEREKELENRFRDTGSILDPDLDIPEFEL